MPLLKKILPIILLCSNIVFGQDNSFQGYATAKIKSDKIEIQTFGFRDSAKTQAYDTLTIQPIGSVSKTFIGLAIMKAVELGLVNLDTDIQQYLDFKVINPNVKRNISISLRHLATHTSGIKDNEKYYRQAYVQGTKSNQTLKAFLREYFEPNGNNYSKNNFGKYQAGEEYNYSNIGAALAAYVLESATKIPFEQFTQQYIFDPLGMKHTRWFYDESLSKHYSQLFDEKDQALKPYTLITYPDGALKTTISDLSRYLHALMKGYRHQSNLLGNQYWDILFTKNYNDSKPVKNLSPKEPNSGIFIIYAKSGAIGHTGSDPGVSVMLFFNPESNEGKIFMANEDLNPQNLEKFKQIWDAL